MLWTAQKSHETAEISSEEGNCGFTDFKLLQLRGGDTGGTLNLREKCTGAFLLNKLSVKTPFLLQ